jgi:hypothetical protein
VDTVIVPLCERILALEPPSMPSVLLEPPLDLTVRLRIIPLRWDVVDSSGIQILFKSTDALSFLFAATCVELAALIRIYCVYIASRDTLLLALLHA